jgi:hypothetical protein
MDNAFVFKMFIAFVLGMITWDIIKYLLKEIIKDITNG